ncbi:hypothetical protein [Cytophaga hutchinsonii]|jgi:nicotinamide mononucleotide adenylyltransferase|uniref:Uncharacterized protein n=1 Tax=Cytophaga hutchinsonii (strain ATCC 33406 / DSM 1761 / CIP 103989 / NBRC 15051 / NCIMB 9469 / D465) TaxID=269798 RepID=A0A6N4SSW0_CYTH3|nr:hypothetical protein [Cytophaga hutchinsonii]ABG59444.1 hypothetical protein CHU_2181 [Cytophaga hutchinsonii ATCC 33406]SFX96269.1 hypothetical protein SAMN04487930_11512 [Cytophaga hutchinsonii ATCC 33406]
MTDIEFELIDSLYFVQTFGFLCNELELNEHDLKALLIGMVQKEWVKVLDKESDEEILSPEIWSANCSGYHYLATKKGLFAHNSL